MCHADVSEVTNELRSCYENCKVISDCNPVGLSNWKGLHIIHVNARNLLPKLADLGLLASLCKAAVTAVLETWLDTSNSDGEAGFSGYHVFWSDHSRHDGGICLLIRTDITFSSRNNIQLDGLEAAWPELILPNTKPIIVGVTPHPSK